MGPVQSIPFADLLTSSALRVLKAGRCVYKCIDSCRVYIGFAIWHGQGTWIDSRIIVFGQSQRQRAF